MSGAATVYGASPLAALYPVWRAKRASERAFEEILSRYFSAGWNRRLELARLRIAAARLRGLRAGSR